MKTEAESAGPTSAPHRLFAYPTTQPEVPKAYPDQWWFKSTDFNQTRVMVNDSTEHPKLGILPKVRLQTKHGELKADCTPQLLRDMAATLLAAADHMDTLPAAPAPEGR